MLVGLIAGALVLFCGFTIVWEVISRGVFDAPTEWVMEISTYCIVIAGFLGMGVAYAGKKHIHVDIFVSRMSPKLHTYVELFTSVIGAFYSYLFMVQSWDMVMLSLELNNCAPTTLGTPLWIPQMAMPIGFAVLLLQIIRTFLEDVVKIKHNDFTMEFGKEAGK
jgi:TRAP-type C4-dicarboxylate transport system permease small subunit